MKKYIIALLKNNFYFKRGKKIANKPSANKQPSLQDITIVLDEHELALTL